MQCPSCKKYSLKPTRLEYGLSALLCTKCHGVLVSLLTYRDWAERNTVVIDKKRRFKVITAEDNKDILLCPKCRRLMTKYKITGIHDNKLDLCNSCDEAWLDDGEWRLLKHLELADKLAAVFTQPWQRNISKEAVKLSMEDSAKEIFQDDYVKIKEIKKWIKDHKLSLQINKYLNDE